MPAWNAEGDESEVADARCTAFSMLNFAFTHVLLQECVGVFSFGALRVPDRDSRQLRWVQCENEGSRFNAHHPHAMETHVSCYI